MNNAKNTFNEQFMYYIAFLAAVIGLGVFKAELADTKITILNLDTSFLSLAIVVVVMMLLSAYLAALAILAKGSGFEKYKLSGKLEFIANLVVGAALLFPLLTFAMQVIYLLTSQILKIFSIQRINTFQNLISVALLLFTYLLLSRLAFRYADNRKKLKYNTQLTVAIESFPKLEKDFQVYIRSDKVIDLLESYGILVRKSKLLLNTLGYNVTSYNFQDISELLFENKVINKSELKIAQDFDNLKKIYSKGESGLDKKQFIEIKTIISELNKKITKKFDAQTKTRMFWI